MVVGKPVDPRNVQFVSDPGVVTFIAERLNECRHVVVDLESWVEIAVLISRDHLRQNVIRIARRDVTSRDALCSRKEVLHVRAQVV